MDSALFVVAAQSGEAAKVLANMLMGSVLLVVAAQRGEAAKVLERIVARQWTVANQLKTPYPKTASGAKGAWARVAQVLLTSSRLAVSTAMRQTS